MKIVALSILILAASFFISFNKKKKHLIKFKITSTSSYCGGMAPSEEILKKLRQPIPLKGKMVFIRKGNINNSTDPIVASAVTDSLGNFTVQLDPGIYCLVDEKKKDKTYYDYLSKTLSHDTPEQTAVDINCLDRWLATPDYVFEVKNVPVSFTYNYNKVCYWNEVPCSQYRGPIPP